jgi:hypothetical protein
LLFLDRQHDALIPKQTRQFDQIVCAREFRSVAQTRPP